MVSYVTVYEDDLKYYKSVVSSNYLQAMADPGHYMIGAVDDKGNVLGAIYFEMDQEIYDDEPFICIMWLYVDPDHRGKGYGHGLINEVISVSKSSGMTDLRAQIPYPDVYDNITDFFRINGFDFMFTDSYTFTSSVEEFSNIGVFKASVKQLNIIPLADVSMGAYKEGIIRLAKSQLGENYKNVMLDREDFDEELSRAYVSEGRLKGIYLVQKRADGSIFSGNLFCEKKNIGLISFNLLRSFAKTATIVCPKETLFRIKCQRDASRRLMEYLLPNWVGEIVRRGSYSED